MLKDKDGKISFARVFGVAIGSLVLVGWIAAGVGYFELPGQTPVLLLIGMTPYLGSKAVDLMKVVAPYISRGK